MFQQGMSLFWVVHVPAGKEGFTESIRWVLLSSPNALLLCVEDQLVSLTFLQMVEYFLC